MPEGRPPEDAVGVRRALRPKFLRFCSQFVVRAGKADAEFRRAVPRGDFHGNVVAVLVRIGNQGAEIELAARAEKVAQLPLQAVAVASRRPAAVVLSVDDEGVLLALCHLHRQVAGTFLPAGR